MTQSPNFRKLEVVGFISGRCHRGGTRPWPASRHHSIQLPCRSPIDGFYPDKCCDEDRRKKCKKIMEQYSIAILEAKECNTLVDTPQCTHKVPDSLVNCSATCLTHVNSITGLTKPTEDWDRIKCESITWACAAYVCVPPSGKVCSVTNTNGQGTCKDLQGVP